MNKKGKKNAKQYNIPAILRHITENGIASASQTDVNIPCSFVIIVKPCFPSHSIDTIIHN